MLTVCGLKKLTDGSMLKAVSDRLSKSTEKE